MPHRRPARRSWHALVLLPVLLSGLVTGGAARSSPGTPRPPAADPVLASLSQTATPPTQVTIDRVAGADRYATAVAVSQRLYPAGDAPVVLLASGTGFADAASAAPSRRARPRGHPPDPGRMRCPIVVAAELTRLAPHRLVVVGGPSAVSDAVLAAAGTATGVTPERLAGADRYATSLALVQDGFPTGPVDTVFLATGNAFPDALSTAPAASVAGDPLLLTPSDRLLDAAAAEIRHLAPAHVVIVGGTAAVSAAVATAVAKLGPTGGTRGRARPVRHRGSRRRALPAHRHDRRRDIRPRLPRRSVRWAPRGLAGRPHAARPTRRDPRGRLDAERRPRRQALHARGSRWPGLGARCGRERAGGLVGRSAGRAPVRARTTHRAPRCTTTTSAWRSTSTPCRRPTPTS